MIRVSCKCISISYPLLFNRFYRTFFGGVSIVSQSAIQRANGLSNLFFGWGGEDDDFQKRMNKSHIHIKLNQLNLSRFYYLEHENDSSYNRKAGFLLADHRIRTRMLRDGIRQTRYTVRDRIVRPLYTLYYINIWDFSGDEKNGHFRRTTCFAAGYPQREHSIFCSNRPESVSWLKSSDLISPQMMPLSHYVTLRLY